MQQLPEYKHKSVGSQTPNPNLLRTVCILPRRPTQRKILLGSTTVLGVCPCAEVRQGPHQATHAHAQHSTSNPPGLTRSSLSTQVGDRDHDDEGPNVVGGGDDPGLSGLKTKPPLYRGDNHIHQTIYTQTLQTSC